MENDFIIDKVGWHTQRAGDKESVTKVHARFKSVITFLQNNKLTRRTILAENQMPHDELSIRVSDLTDEGFSIIRTCYDKWLRGVDKGKSPNDVKMFERKLLDIRKQL